MIEMCETDIYKVLCVILEIWGQKESNSSSSNQNSVMVNFNYFAD